ncbi:hypothetical protein GCK32_006406 [Trichostrongylus colubriformis]|uniref:Uncharacterized protein n=1 Tax=Trichostrongylus colubriformis TaxID=6319 RepID=A0AAN8IRK5_TRICO
MLVRSFAIGVFVFVAAIVHIICYKEQYDDSDATDYRLYQRREYGSSLWLALGALVLAAIDTVIAGFSV